MFSAQRPGMSVIEVLVALGMASILIFSVGNLVSATHRLNTASAAEEKAVLVAQAQLEQLVSFARDPATASSLFVTHAGEKYYLDTSGSPWVLKLWVTGVPGTPEFNWMIITSDVGDTNVQHVTSVAKWTSGAIIHQEQITTVLTYWKNLVP